jgi:ribosome-binding factor A
LPPGCAALAMPRDFSRAARIADQIQRDLSGLIRQEIKDPRVGLVTITAVEVNRDLSHARVFVSSLGEVTSTEQSVDALQHAAGFLRSQLARTLKLRSVPHLHFVYDSSVERGARLSHLIDEAVAGSGQPDAGRDSDDS